MNIFPVLLLYLVFLLTLGKAQNNTNLSLRDSCDPVPTLKITNRTRELECCNEILQKFQRRWFNESIYLTSVLATLQAWNCPQFNEECTNRTFDFTTYTALVYERFCNESKLIKECASKVIQVQQSSLPAVASSFDLTNTSWSSLAQNLTSASISSSDLEEPCIQIALLDSPSGGYGNYHEIKNYILPFCEAAWCGYDTDTFTTRRISSWSCMPSRCRANIIILMTVSILLAIAITIGNATVIVVYGTSKKLLHSQTIFRLALGCADFIVGAVIFPAAVYTLYALFLMVTNFEVPYEVTGDAIDGTNMVTIKIRRIQNSEQAQEANFLPYYAEIIGFVTTLSFTLSIYLLAVSGIDRLIALWRPLRYAQDKAKRFAWISCLVTLALASLVSSTPFYVTSLRYAVSGSMLVTIVGASSLIVYICAFILPLIFTWSVSLAIYFVAKRNFKERRQLYINAQQNLQQHRRLNRILALIVTAFSLSIIPTILVLIIVIFLPNTSPIFRGQKYNSFNNAIANALELIAAIILTCNSLWNCLIYSARNKEFRKVAAKRYEQLCRVTGLLAVHRAFKKCCKSCRQKRSTPTSTHSSNVRASEETLDGTVSINNKSLGTMGTPLSSERKQIVSTSFSSAKL
ncbi:unnamed protein product [Clavelina lepadiformis]|uniref:G-protein coupled receptors family 1 profile domain-containing protein n=1 Tax=Clavelina lepadiformis TaxID=159417 RepID=A0ABP0FWT9_CLALP